MVGILSIIQNTTIFTSISSSRLAAAYLAQGGVEVVKNIRDSNWLKQRVDPDVNWDTGLPIGNWEADYKTQTLTRYYSGSYLYIDSDSGFYTYISFPEPNDIKTRFKRKITVQKEDLTGDALYDEINITVQIEWKERGKDYSVSAQEILYKWR